MLLDVLTEDPAWSGWSSAALAAAADRGRLVVDPIVYAEVSVRFSRIEDLDAALSPERFAREPTPWRAAFEKRKNKNKKDSYKTKATDINRGSPTDSRRNGS